MSIRLTIATTLIGMGGATLSLGQPLASGTWSKLSVSADGVYKIDYSLLKKSGFNPDVLDPEKLQLFSNGTGMLPQAINSPRQNQLKEVAIFVQGAADGKFDPGDYILFFGQGPDVYRFDTVRNIFSYANNIYSDKNYYFLTVGTYAGKRLTVSASQGGTFPLVNQFDDFGYYESDQYNILSSGRDWFGEQFGSNGSVTVQFNLPGVIDNSPVTFVSHVMAQSYDAPSSFKILFNNVEVLEQDIATIPNSQYAIKGMEAIDTVVVNSGNLNAAGQAGQNIQYQYTKASSGTSIGYLNFFLFSVTRALGLYGNQTIFTSHQSLANPVSTFDVGTLPSTALIWDVTDPFSVQNQGYTSSGNESSFSVSTTALKTFTVFLPDKVSLPVFEGAVANQNLSGLGTPDLLIICHPSFKSQAMRLASYRQGQNISVQVVAPQDIYNEYSGGKQDVTAIRDFIRDVNLRTPGVLDNLLLFGRCSYDYKDRFPGNTNFVPTYESRNSLDPLSTYSSDDYFAFLQPNEGDWPEDPAVDYPMDIGVGRISVVTLQQAQDVVDKLIDFETNPARLGTWRKNFVFVADDGDANLHQSSADQLATSIDALHPEFTTEKVYLDQFKQVTTVTGQYSPDAKDALDRSVKNGAAIVNYTGHGSVDVWMQEQVLDPVLVQGWKNAPMYPLFVTATCEFGRHDDPFQISSGELVQLQPKGGGIGLVTTSRPVNASTNQELNLAFYAALFAKSGGAYRNLGAIFRDTKNNSLSGVANRNFSLLGDPSMYMGFAQNQVVTDQIKTVANSDTLSGLSGAMLTAEIQRGGSKRTDFNGVADITVFDRPASFTTLGDENPPFTYTQWSNALFRGKATVNGGNFQVQFTLPGNIEPDIGTGKITFYASTSSEDANGVSTVYAGGIATSFAADNSAPDIQLFMGDTTFVNGGLASPNTTLVIKLHDAHGIAISGYGGSNSIIATLDDSLTYVINDYYTSDKNDDTNGEALFPLYNLRKGKHTIVVNASDTYDNRASASVDFIITEGNLVVSEFYNYPNPFSESSQTILTFVHNRPGEDLEVELSVSNMAGQVVATEEFTISQSFTQVTLTQWDGTANGNKLSNGIYVGKLSVRSLVDGSKNQQFTKLIIIN